MTVRWSTATFRGRKQHGYPPDKMTAYLGDGVVGSVVMANAARFRPAPPMHPSQGNTDLRQDS